MKKKYDIGKSEIRGLLSDENTTEPGIDDIGQTEDALVKFAAAHAIQPPLGLREKILAKIDTLENQKHGRKKN